MMKKMIYRLNFVVFLVAIVFASSGFGSELVHYELYEPESAEYKVSPSEKQGGFSYNDQPSIEYFEGLFYAAWQANSENKAEVSGRRIYISTSKNLITWTKPVDFLVRQSINPSVPSVISDEKQGYPILYNYKDKQLWCFWCIDGLPSEKTSAGLHLSVLEAGSKLWYSSLILQKVQMGESEFYTIPTGRPVQLRSGRFMLPVRLCQGGLKDGGEFSVPAFLYSNDEGKTWDFGATASMPENGRIQCDTTIHQQVNGKIRAFSLPNYRNNLPPLKRLLTTTGSGSELEDDLEFETDLRPASMETASGNIATLLLSTKRYAMVMGDIFAEINGSNLCYNPAIFFSRTGENDFIGGYPFALGKEVSHSQIIEKDGKLYIIYSQEVGTDQPSKISLSWVQLPEEEKHYIFPRSKNVLRAYDTSYIRSKDGGFFKRIRQYNNQLPSRTKDRERDIMVFKNSAAAAIDIKPVNLKKDESIEISMSMKISELQDDGQLTLLTIGDEYPVKMVMPSSRADDIYLCAPGIYRKIASREDCVWFMVKIVFDKDNITFTIDDEEPVTASSKLVSQRFYMGNNCLQDVTNTNDGSIFCVDIESVTSKANRKKSFIDY